MPRTIRLTRTPNGFELSVPTEYLGFVRFVRGDPVFPQWHWAAWDSHAENPRRCGAERTALAATRAALKAARPLFGGSP